MDTRPVLTVRIDSATVEVDDGIVHISVTGGFDLRAPPGQLDPSIMVHIEGALGH